MERWTNRGGLRGRTVPAEQHVLVVLPAAEPQAQALPKTEQQWKRDRKAVLLFVVDLHLPQITQNAFAASSSDSSATGTGLALALQHRNQISLWQNGSGQRNQRHQSLAERQRTAQPKASVFGRTAADSARKRQFFSRHRGVFRCFTGATLASCGIGSEMALVGRRRLRWGGGEKGVGRRQNSVGRR